MIKNDYFNYLKEKGLDALIPMYERIEIEFKIFYPYIQIDYGRASLFITFGASNYICDFRHQKKQISMYVESKHSKIIDTILTDNFKVTDRKGMNKGLKIIRINRDCEDNIDKIVEVMVEIQKNIK